ncbi:MAG: hypothetical protein KDD48_06610 [Bdellovibrionales bacterium]|nr:hypothetical protein [Bdellovibrionales bacterium]
MAAVLCLIGVVSCSRVAEEERHVDQEFANLCLAYEAIAMFSLSNHIEKTSDDFALLRSNALRQSLEKNMIKVSESESSQLSCESIEQALEKSGNVTKKAFYIQTLEGFVSSLDPHSRYVSEDRYEDYKNYQKNKRKSYGVTFDFHFRNHFLPLKELSVKEVLTDEAKRYLAAGDHVLAINNIPIKDHYLKDFSEMFEDQKSTITLEVEDKGKITLGRTDYNIPPIRFKVLDDDDQRYFYIGLRNFGEGMTDYFEKHYGSLYNKNTTDGVIVDLRGNPGGLLLESIRFLSHLTQQRLSVQTVGPINKPQVSARYSLNRNYIVEPKSTFQDLPIGIQIDPNTASAAEILAAALKPTKAVIVGYDRTFGKGNGQQSLRLSTRNGLGGTLNLTMFRYYLNAEDTPQLHGVEPEAKISDPELEAFLQNLRKEDPSLIIHESDYENAISIKPNSIPGGKLLSENHTLEQKTFTCDFSRSDCELDTTIMVLDFLNKSSYFEAL